MQGAHDFLKDCRLSALGAECKGHMTFSRTADRVLWGSQTKAGFVSSNQKEWGWVSFSGPGRQGKMFITRAFGGVISETYTAS